jgi:hypothetical protein
MDIFVNNPNNLVQQKLKIGLEDMERNKEQIYNKMNTLATDTNTSYEEKNSEDENESKEKCLDKEKTNNSDKHKTNINDNSTTSDYFEHRQVNNSNRGDDTNKRRIVILEWSTRILIVYGLKQ